MEYVLGDIVKYTIPGKETAQGTIICILPKGTIPDDDMLKQYFNILPGDVEYEPAKNPLSATGYLIKKNNGSCVLFSEPSFKRFKVKPYGHRKDWEQWQSTL